MALYFGCGTGKNQLAWSVFAAFLIVSIGCWIGFGVNLSKCAISAAGPADGPCAVLNDRQLWSNSDIDIDARSISEAASQVCRQEFGFTRGTQTYDDCVECLSTVSKCVISRSWIFIVAVIFLALAFIPCVFFCCCSNSPAKKGENASKGDDGVPSTKQDEGVDEEKPSAGNKI